MAKYYGNIGFATLTETSPGIWEDVIEERPYKGDILRGGRRWDNSGNVNDNFSVTNVFSIISDAFLYSHVPEMRYLIYLGTPFKITSVEIERPRVTINVGGVYAIENGTSSSSESPSGNTGE